MPRLYIVVSDDQKAAIEQLADAAGVKSTSEFVRTTLVDALDLPAANLTHGDPTRLPNYRQSHKLK